MKKILTFLAFAVLAISCKDDKAREKSLLDTITKAHEKVMVDDGLIMKNIMALKPYSAAPATKDSVAIYSKNLSNADDVMMDWMNKFNPDFAGKSHEETMAYLTTQKAQVLKVDSLINSAVAASDKYLTKIKTK